MAFSTEYQVVYDALVTAGDTPSAPIANIQDQLTRSLVRRGYWLRFDLLYIFAQEFNSGGGARINWPTPGTFDATEVNAPAWISLEGYTGDGSTSLIQSGYNPTDDAINYLLDSAAIGVYIRTNVEESRYDCGVAVSADQLSIYSRFGGNSAACRINSGAAINAASSDSRGFWLASRRASDEQEFYKNEGSIGSSSGASTGLPTSTITFCARSASYSTKQQGFGFVINGVTDSEALEIFGIFELYMQNIGSGVTDTLFSSCDESLSVTEAQTEDAGEETGTVAESLSITEAQTGQVDRDGADAESASIDEAQTAQAVFNSTISESASISEAQTADEETEGAITESASIDEVQTAQAELNADVAESASITEAQTGEVEGAESASISESVSIDDAPTVQAELSDSVLESLSISDTCDAQLISNPDVTESLAIEAIESIKEALTTITYKVTNINPNGHKVTNPNPNGYIVTPAV